MQNGGVTLTKVIENQSSFPTLTKWPKYNVPYWPSLKMAINQVENLIDRVWTEENGRPPNTHKKVFIEEQ